MSFDEIPDVLASLVAEVHALRDEVRALRSGGSPTDLLTAEQAAPLAGVKPDTLRGWAAKGKVRVAGSGRPLRFRLGELEEDVARMRASRRVRPDADLEDEEWARQHLARRGRGG